MRGTDLLKEKLLEIVVQEMIPEEVKNRWPERNFGELVTIRRGGSPRPIKNYITQDSDGINWIKIGDTVPGEKYITKTQEKIKREGLCKSRAVFKGDFLLSNSMSFGRPYILKIDGAIHDGWLSISDYEQFFDTDFLFYLLSSNYVKMQLQMLAKGSTVKNLNIERVSSITVIVPPKDIQQKIVSTVEANLLEIEKLNQEYEKYLHFVSLLKEKTLELAMQGKLVPQLPEEGTASSLLEEVTVERQRLVDEKIIKKTKKLPEITKDEIPYEIPESWEWVRLGSVIYPQKTVKEKPEEFYYIDISSINNELQKVESPELISAEGSPSRASKYVEEGDVVFSTVRPYLKNIAVVTSEYKNVIASTGFYVMRGIGKVNNEFLYYLSQSEYFLGAMTRMMRGDNSPSVRNNDLEEFVIPIPPADEQVRIVNKLKEIRQNI